MSLVNTISEATAAVTAPALVGVTLPDLVKLKATTLELNNVHNANIDTTALEAAINNVTAALTNATTNELVQASAAHKPTTTSTKEGSVSTTILPVNPVHEPHLKAGDRLVFNTKTGQAELANNYIKNYWIEDFGSNLSAQSLLIGSGNEYLCSIFIVKPSAASTTSLFIRLRNKLTGDEFKIGKTLILGVSTSNLSILAVKKLTATKVLLVVNPNSGTQLRTWVIEFDDLSAPVSSNVTLNGSNGSSASGTAISSTTLAMSDLLLLPDGKVLFLIPINNTESRLLLLNTIDYTAVLTTVVMDHFLTSFNGVRFGNYLTLTPQGNIAIQSLDRKFHVYEYTAGAIVTPAKIEVTLAELTSNSERVFWCHGNYLTFITTSTNYFASRYTLDETNDTLTHDVNFTISPLQPYNNNKMLAKTEYGIYISETVNDQAPAGLIYFDDLGGVSNESVVKVGQQIDIGAQFSIIDNEVISTDLSINSSNMAVSAVGTMDRFLEMQGIREDSVQHIGLAALDAASGQATVNTYYPIEHVTNTGSSVKAGNVYVEGIRIKPLLTHSNISLQVLDRAISDIHKNGYELQNGHTYAFAQEAVATGFAYITSDDGTASHSSSWALVDGFITSVHYLDNSFGTQYYVHRGVVYASKYFFSTYLTGTTNAVDNFINKVDIVEDLS